MKTYMGLGVALILSGCSQSPERKPVDPQPQTDKLETKSGEQPSTQERVTLHVRDGDIMDVIGTIAKLSGKLILASPEVKGTITVSINNVPWQDAVMAIAKTLNYKAVFDGPNSARIVRSE